ncbi:MAG: histidine-type phosphatase [Bacteroidaceae bacterium]|nr:histidine-type phosphatase [Bacteroidaceae bacterium]
MKTRFALLIALCAITFGLSAQNTLEEIRQHKELAGGNMAVYPVPTEALTPAPKGYQPFYLSHYARHGSRYHTGENSYKQPIETLQKAKDNGVLSAEGEKILALLIQVYDAAKDRYGDLTKVGALQHRGIGRRMYQNFPEIFTKEIDIDARSTTVIRSILSKVNECMELQSLNGKLHFTNEASPHDMYYMNHSDPVLNQLMRTPEYSKAQSSIKRTTNPDRLMRILFTSQDYVRWALDANALMSQLLSVATGIQDMDFTPDFNLLDYFTAEECYDFFQSGNLYWYLAYGPAKETRGLMPYRMAPLLQNILDTADEALALPKESATLRFGHDTVIMPLACLLELDHWGNPVNNMADLANVYPDYRLIPMASNIQIVFYKHRKTGDILVKFMLNERECTIPVQTDMAPYYHWNDVEQYYRAKLQKFEQTRVDLEKELPVAASAR